MSSSPHRRFVRTLAVFGAIAILLPAVVSPPDPYAQFVYAAPLLLLALLLAVLRSYTDAFKAFERDGHQ
ncbi:hypothetical protein C488_10623 [Natrinema pellirubrum DSM 15624]|uniref:Uncharacterized protein n=1 Tax=Natrinema pellirubrum (strain DSM 15624 / CIP 106293 / JCM 10476 / NCIMB 786 / 157) TaxID=797303 RepID=L0JIE4_NATP1|nr:hypothetical protein [Natrinema pellirubrum]AGB30628.1 hypothetical protein Natpe_0704 [Natrinema pellirubrum DSM 15624]ELY74898.1 hypothetical protein C488_10623 [Natrinema pellirubrum DSM 15624]